MSGLEYYLFYRTAPSDNLASAYQAYAAALANIGFRLDASCQNNMQTFTHQHARLTLSLEPLSNECAQDLAHGLLGDQLHLVPLLGVQHHVVTITHKANSNAPAWLVAQICNKAIEKIHNLHHADIICTPQLEWFDLTYSNAYLSSILAAANPSATVTNEEIAFVEDKVEKDCDTLTMANTRAALTFEEEEESVPTIDTAILSGKISPTARGTLWCSSFAFTIGLGAQGASASPLVEMTTRILGLF